MPPQSERFSMVLPKWLKDAITDLAKKKGVSLSEYVKDLLKREVLEERERETRR